MEIVFKRGYHEVESMTEEVHLPPFKSSDPERRLEAGPHLHSLV